jgi:hypothetical protein
MKGHPHHRDLGLWKGRCHIFPKPRSDGEYDVNISWLLKDLLYKDIPLTLYVRTKNVMDR